MSFYPKKRLGQNFLIDKNTRHKIIENCELKKDDYILEIGAGRGELTKELANKVKKVIAVEFDRDLYEILKENLRNFKNIELICTNILKLKIKELSFKKRIKVIGNLPFYLTTPIIIHLVEQRRLVDKIFITVQKEVARRFIAQPQNKDYSSFSCFLQYYTKPSILFFIKKGNFWPVPTVDCAFISLVFYKKPPVKLKDEKLFFKIIRKGFGNRRKMLKNNLGDIFDKEKLLSAFNLLNLNPNVRAEDLSLEKFATLANQLKQL